MGRVREEKRREEERRKSKREEKRRKKIKKRKSQKKEDPGARKGRKVASKSRFAKAAGAEPAGQMRDEKVHAVVAQSTFPSQNVQSTPGLKHC